MPDAQQLAALVRYSGPMLTRFLDGFTDETRTTQAPGLPNHVAWTLGHTAYTMHRLADQFGDEGLPPEDFVDGPADATRFDRQSLRLGSTPTPDSAAYPTLDRCAAIFERAHERLASAVEGADQADFEREVDWGGVMRPLGELVMRVSLHNATHAGQLCDLRRALGMPRVFG